MLSVGLTGNVASGKSSVARLWRDAGVPVVSADNLSRTATEPGSEGLEEVVRAFGEDVLADDGTLDRAALRDVVFRDDDARHRLEEILHPRIRDLREAWLREREAEGEPLVVSEIPLLFETGMETAFDLTVLVDASREERLRRLVEDRGLEADEAERIMDAQMDPAEKRRRADLVVENDGTLQDLRARALIVLDLLLARAAGAPERAGPSGGARGGGT